LTITTWDFLAVEEVVKEVFGGEIIAMETTSLLGPS
jgi:hypothetical protein